MKRSYSFQDKQHILSFVEEAKTNPNLRGQSVSQLIRLASTPRPPPSRASYYSWLRTPLTQEELRGNLSRRGRHALLTEEQKMLLLGFACHRRRLLKTVSLQHLRDFSSTHFDVVLHNSTVSTLMKDRGFSLQRTLKRNSRMTTQKVVNDAIQFLEKVRGYDYPPDRVIVMDETGLWSNTIERNTYHFRGGFVSSLFSFPSFSSFFHLSPIISFLAQRPRHLFPVLLSFLILGGTLSW